MAHQHGARSDVSLTVRVSGAPEVIAQLKQIVGSTQEVSEETKRASEETKRAAESARQHRVAITSSRAAVLGFSSALHAVSLAAALWGGENTKLAQTVTILTSVVGTATTALSALRAAQAGATAGWIAVLGPLGVIAGVTVLVVAAIDKLTRGMGVLRAAILVVIPPLGLLLRYLERMRALAPESAAQVALATDAIVQMNLFDRQQAEQTAELHKRHFLEESARLDRLAVERKRAAAEAARLAKQAAELARQLREAAFAREAADIAQFNVWQRQQWEEAAQRRTAIFLAESERLKEERVRLEQETNDLIVLANQQALEAIGQAERDRLEETRRVLAEIAKLEQETADLIGLANQQAIQAIEEAEAAALAAGQELLNQQKALFQQLKQQAETFAQNFVSTLSNAFVDVLTGAKEFGQGMTDLFQALKRMILQTIIEEALKPLQQMLSKFFSGLFGQGQGLLGILLGFLPFLFFQRGTNMVVSRPTPLMVGETGPERVTVTPLARPFAGAGAGGGQVNFYGPVFLDDISASQLYRRYIEPAQQRAAAQRVG